MTIGIVGLGLIGGSFARVIKYRARHKVLAFDLSESAFLEAQLVGAVDGKLTEETLPNCDIVLIAIYPSAAADYVRQNARLFKQEALVIDCGGVKRKICAELIPIAAEHGFCFIGGHPMAGTQFWGFNHSRNSLFKNSPMILTPQGNVDIKALEKAKKFFLDLEFGEVVFSEPEEHDRIIAYTSQLPHVVSSAYIKNPAAAEHKGFSAGSYKDLSRVARLNENMWSELFLENRDNLIGEIDVLIKNLSDYRGALEKGDREELTALLKEGRERKERIEKEAKVKNQ